MSKVKDLDQCQFYGCKNPQHDDPSGVVTVTLPNEPEPVEVLPCFYHSAILSMGSDKFLVGRAYNNEIELRPVAAVPAPPTPQEA